MVLQDSLIELMREKPISKITIKELCQNADLNRTTFYAHYTDQYDLLRSIEDETLTWAKDAVNILNEKRSEHEIKKVLEGICQYFADNSKHLQVLMSEQGDINFQKELFTLIYRQCGIDSLADYSGDNASRELYFLFIVTGSIGLIQHWLKSGIIQPANDIAGIIYHMTMIAREGAAHQLTGTFAVQL